jgi:hypothetical protein
MRTLHLGLALAFLLSGTISAEAAKGQKGKKAGRPVQGVVVSVSKDKDKNSGTITVQVRANKKKNQDNAAPPVEKTFQFTDATKFQVNTRVKGQKGKAEQSAATVADVVQGVSVSIQTKGDAAETVNILKGGKIKKKKN